MTSQTFDLNPVYWLVSAIVVLGLLYVVLRPEVPREPEPPALPPTPEEQRARELAGRWLEANGLAHGVNDPLYRESLVRTLLEMAARGAG